MTKLPRTTQVLIRSLFVATVLAGLTVPAQPAVAYRAHWADSLDARAGDAVPRTPTQSFRSQPHLHPPKVSVTADPSTASGDIFLAPYNAPQPGPMILDSRGRLVWFRRLRHGPATNLEVQRYHGHSVLTWWQGVFDKQGRAQTGQDVILDSAYRTVAVLHAGNGYVADPHEFQITPQGTALIDAWVPEGADLSSLGGSSSGTVLDCVIQELDIRTNQVLWQWDALVHVPVTDSYAKMPSGSAPYDYFHLNSIQQLPDGNLLISARNTWAAYEISRQTGNVIWTLGGKRSSFAMGPGTNFEWQHDARMHAGGALTLFDDAALPQEENQSSAKALTLDTHTMTASLAHRYDHSPPLLAGTQGNAQLLPGGDVFVGWGSQPYFSEYTPRGRQIFNGSFALGVESYRAYRFHWRARPATRPAMAARRRRNGAVRVYASWNGATAVRAWRVLGGPRRHGLRSVGGTMTRRGFETMIPLDRAPAYLAVEALGRGGRVLGTSTVHADRRRTG
ncbi:MAG: arylsulfotransferase family protein [Solirubrobacteraceae bacterium]